MPETVRVDRDLGVIFIDSRSDVNEDDLHQSLHTVLQIVENEGITRILVDATHQDSLPSTLPVFKFASRLSKETRGLKHAIVFGRQSEHDLRFIETVSTNRGAVFRTFESTEEALSWLKG